MPIRYGCVSVCCGVLIFVLLGTGCTSTSIGDTEYSNGTFVVPVSNSGETGDAFIQVTVYEIRNFSQQKIIVYQEPVTLRHGQNMVIVPGTLSPGNYKLYIYILKTDERQTATIRDIVV